MGHVIAVAGKGGVGKTTLCGLLIQYLCESGKKPVLAVDADAKAAAAATVTQDNTLDDAPTAADFAALNAFAKHALKTVSQQRSDLGAIQNRLEHTISNLDNIVENTTAAESQIRDTDMASQMVEYSKNQILAQAGQSMLAQANQSNQGVLSLLQ